MDSERDRQSILRSHGTRLTLDGREIHGIFRDGFEAIQLGPAGVINGQQITARVSALDAAEARRGSALMLNGNPYRVENVEPDGIGYTRLVLVKAH